MRALAVFVVAATVAAAVACTQAQRESVSLDQNAPLSIAKQGSFFLGGRTVQSDTLSSFSGRPPDGTITIDQIYVHYQIPTGVVGTPIVLIHGCCLTGKTWETTPDGRMGWDEYFLRKGRPVYVVDQAARGRSAVDITAINAVKMGKAERDKLPTLFFVPHEAVWVRFRFGPEFQKPFPGLMFPVDAIDEFFKQTVPDWIESMPTPNPTIPALSELAQRLDGAILVSHSQSGIYPFAAAELSTKGIAGIVAIEPGACPEADSDVTPYLKTPALVLWGDYVSESPLWAPRFKGCEVFASAVKKAGGRIENVSLPAHGFSGNSHMLMQDRNSLDIAGWLMAWIERNFEGALK